MIGAGTLQQEGSRAVTRRSGSKSRGTLSLAAFCVIEHTILNCFDQAKTGGKCKVLGKSTTVERKFKLDSAAESIAFGLTDGVICFLGIIVGVAKATNDPIAVIIAAVIGGIADAFGNSIGFFVSQSTERTVQIHNADTEDDAHIHSEKEVLLSGIFSFLATLIALVLLLAPLLFLKMWPATAVSFVIGTILAFVLGSYVGRLGKQRPYKSGIKYALITIAGAAVSYGIGNLLNLWLY